MALQRASFGSQVLINAVIGELELHPRSAWQMPSWTTAQLLAGYGRFPCVKVKVQLPKPCGVL